MTHGRDGLDGSDFPREWRVDGRPLSGRPGASGESESPHLGATASAGPTPSPDQVSPPPVSDCGRVYLVGAGPGDPGLLTRRAWDLLVDADAVLHDSLTSEAVLEELPTDVTVVDVGKRPPDPVSQAEIHEKLTGRATDGESVVRLKGGDPGVFGRGGEEAEHLATEGIPFEVVPGVSSLTAGPAVAGIPLTHRDHASSLTVVTGQETPDKGESALDWTAIAGAVRAGGTLVVLMGVSSLPSYVRLLQEEGVAGDTPLAIVQKATWSDELTLTTTVEDAVREARTADIEPPAVTIVGDVVGVRTRVEEAHRAD